MSFGFGYGFPSYAALGVSSGPALNLNFMLGTLDSRILFTRSSSATYIGSDGLVKSAATDVPRFDYDPQTLSLRGFLVEESRTNLLNFSQTFATSGGTQNNWVDSANLQRVSTTRISPDGTGNALEIKANGAANQTIISSAAAGSSDARVFSIWLKRVSGTGAIQYTLDNGVSWTTQAITSSWLRYEIAPTTANQQVGIRITTNGDTIQLWGAQLEAATCVSSYIPTTNSSVIRQADVATISPVSSFFNQTSGTLFSQFIPKCEDTSANRGIVSIDDASNNNRIAMFIPAGASILVAPRVVAGGVSSNPGNSAAINELSISKAALAYAVGTNQAALSVNGQTPSTASPAASPSGVTTLRIGAIFGVTQLGGWIQQISYYITRLTNSELQTLTSVSVSTGALSYSIPQIGLTAR